MATHFVHLAFSRQSNGGEDALELTANVAKRLRRPPTGQAPVLRIECPLDGAITATLIGDCYADLLQLTQRLGRDPISGKLLLLACVDAERRAGRTWIEDEGEGYDEE